VPPSKRGQPAAQVLTSDLEGCALALLPDHIGRWGIENRIKYDAEHYGTDLICDYEFTIVPDERIVDNPARKAANTAAKAARAALDRARADFAAMLADPAIPAKEKNQTLIGRHENTSPTPSRSSATPSPPATSTREDRRERREPRRGPRHRARQPAPAPNAAPPDRVQRRALACPPDRQDPRSSCG
jgi:hypothetical protein